MYPALSTEAPHPAQRDAFLKAYQYLLDQGVPVTRIVFMGDSAGGLSSYTLIYLSLAHCFFKEGWLC